MSMVSIPCLSSSARCESRSRRARTPPCMTGWSVLTLSVQDFGGACEVGDLGHGQAGVGEVAGGAAGADEFIAGVGEDAG